MAAERVIGVLHPGEMGAALGLALRGRGHTVLWASAGRGPASAARAADAGLEDAGTVAELARRCDLVLSVCPPHAARDVAAQAAGGRTVFVDANAVSPATARAIGAAVEAGGGRFVDGGLVGPPPYRAGTTRLYLSGGPSAAVADAFAGTAVDARIVSDRAGDASATKMVYASWTKGQAALLLAARAVARAEGVEAELLREWALSQPDLAGACVRAAHSAGAKGWRWVGEMEEIAATYADAGQPAGFHRAAAEVFARAPREPGTDPGADLLERVLAAIAAGPRSDAPVSAG
jgi:3-hydroxyisobutyrate dehydrogenase-like beta-hydroxyacid dehydrogenase